MWRAAAPTQRARPCAAACTPDWQPEFVWHPRARSRPPARQQASAYLRGRTACMASVKARGPQ
eukprot:4936156-Prymnesium_polylepis.1